VELFIFGRFHARAGDERAVEEALRDVVAPSRAEAGCLSIQAFRSARDPRLFYIHSRWVDEAAFDHHAGLPHTVRFIERVQALIDHPLDVTRARLLG
jgi:quinol monooxygenase YgiN